MNYNRYYREQKGYGLDEEDNVSVFRGAQWQEGAGLGTTFKKFFKWISPLLKKVTMPVIDKGVSAVKNQALDSIVNIANDVKKGKSFTESVKENANQAFQNLKQKAEDTLQGKGIKRSKHRRKYIILKKRSKSTKDIFGK